MHIQMLPAWSKLAKEEDVPPDLTARLPSGWRLYAHQVETYRALTEGTAEVIFNTAMTGDGKSLAGQLPALVDKQGRPFLAMYPTNELIRDQERQLAGAQNAWRANVDSGIVDGRKLDEIMAPGDYQRRGDALLGVLRNYDAVLTNPDIFYLLMHQFYLYPGDARDRYVRPMMQKYGQLTFDEFHIFEVPQVVSVLNALLLLDEMGGSARPHRYLFLSATPGELMLRYLERSGLAVREIVGEYLHTEDEPDLGSWRRILHKARLHFSASRVEEWVEAHLEDTLLPFFETQGPAAKGALIVNSVAAANRLVERLRPEFARRGLCVEPNTGLTSRSRRAASYEADLLVGTSTVDVGVDFQINFLVFESRDAGSFLQRLGRLGRHEGYERAGRFYRFDRFEAHALVPQWVEAALFAGRDGAKPLLQAGQSFDRESLSQAIREAYPPPAPFDAYGRLWGELQTVRIMRGLSHPTVREQYRDLRGRLGERYEATFDIRLRAAFGRYAALRKEQKALVEEAEAFRGGSYFACCLIDDTESGAERFKTADLFSLVPNTHLAWIEAEQFYAEAEKAGCQRITFERQKPVGFFGMGGWRKERGNYRLFLDRDLRGWGADRFGTAQVLKGWKIIADLDGLSSVNRSLCRRQIPTLLCLGYHPLEIKRRLRLPLLFALYEFQSRDGVAGAVAFGRQALMIEARLRCAKLDCGGGAMIL